MIAEYTLSQGRFNSLVIKENPKTVIVYGPGKLCSTCSGLGYGKVPITATVPASDEDARPVQVSLGYERIPCESCNGKQYEGVKQIKLDKSKITLRPCALMQSNYSYIGRPNQ